MPAQLTGRGPFHLEAKVFRPLLHHDAHLIQHYTCRRCLRVLGDALTLSLHDAQMSRVMQGAAFCGAKRASTTNCV
jgi:hypothetical protein